LAQSDGSTAESPSIGGSLPESPAAETPPAPTLARVHVIVENVESDEGTVWVALCDSGLSVEGCPYKLSVKATAGFDEVTFTDIPPGVYAVAGYHDVNDNNVFDQIMKIPREPYALSGAAGDKLVPTFDEAALTFVPGDNEVIIRMRRLTGG
jgi:uncharacterized protein (DUF2141 family)